jgi:dienelactone hydrolase
VIVVHGGSANQEMYLWGSEALAEAGYMVLTFQIPEPDNAQSDFHYPDTKDALDFFTSTPAHRTRAGDVNPLWQELDRGHIGLAGHSAGGVAVSRIGQEDRRISAVVSWDRAQSSPMPAGLRLRTPALFVVADFNCQRVPVCVPQPYPSPPDPKGPGNKDQDFQRVDAAGLDSMKIALRAATHLDFTQFPPGTGSRYGAVTTSYYTLAWFDRYLRGAMPHQRALADDAFHRLTAARFDASADVHNISGGTFDPQTAQNVPARIGGQPVRDRLSFHFRSAWSFDHRRIRCEDIRAGCRVPATAPALSQGVCSAARRIVVLPRPRRGDRIRTVTVRIGTGRTRAAKLLGRHRVVVNLGARRGKVSVLVRGTTVSGRKLRVKRRYSACP